MRHLLPCLLLFLAAAVTGRAETLTLDDCLREVARNNPAIEIQRAQMREALGSRLILRARALPSLRVGLYAGQQGDEGTSIERAGDLRDDSGKRVAFPDQRIDRGSRLFAIGNGQFLQPLFDAAIPPSFRRGTLEIAVAKENFVSVAASNLNQARLQFYQALYAREVGRILGEVSQRLDANSREIGDLVKSGLVGRQRLLQAQVQRSSYDTPVLAFQGTYENAVATLWRLMGRQGGYEAGDPLKQLTLAGSLADARLPTFDAAKVIPEALATRPDIKYLREMVQADKEDARIARAGYYPVVQLIVTGQVLPQNFVRSSRPNAVRAGDEIDTNEVRFGGRYSWTVIDTGGVQGSAQRIDHLREALEASLRHVEGNVSRDVALLRALCDNLSSQAEGYRGNLATAADTLKIVSDAVKQGTASQLEVIDAENGELNTQLGLLNVQLQTNNALAEFDRITGGYVRLVEDQSPASPATHPPTAKER